MYNVIKSANVRSKFYYHYMVSFIYGFTYFMQWNFPILRVFFFSSTCHIQVADFGVGKLPEELIGTGIVRTFNNLLLESIFLCAWLAAVILQFHYVESKYKSVLLNYNTNPN